MKQGSIARMVAGGALAVATAAVAFPPGPGRPPTLAEMDADGDGSVTAAEFTAAVQTRVSAHFADIDANDDGVITAEEFAAPAVERASDHFADLDTDGNGVLTAAELAARRHGRRGRGGPPPF